MRFVFETHSLPDAERMLSFASQLVTRGVPVIVLRDPIVLFDQQFIPPELRALEEADILCFGSMTAMRAIKTQHPGWRPGVWCNDEACNQQALKSRIGYAMLNADHEVHSWSTVKDDPSSLFGRFGSRLFVKPAKDTKIFNGCVVDRDGWAVFREHANANGRKLDLMDAQILVSAATKSSITHEWRFIVRECGGVVTGSAYKVNGRADAYRDNSAETYDAERLAEEISRVGLKIDPLYCVDVCRLGNGEFKVIELNPLSPAGLYACDKEKLADEVLKICGELYG